MTEKSSAVPAWGRTRVSLTGPTKASLLPVKPQLASNVDFSADNFAIDASAECRATDPCNRRTTPASRCGHAAPRPSGCTRSCQRVPHGTVCNHPAGRSPHRLFCKGHPPQNRVRGVARGSRVPQGTGRSCADQHQGLPTVGRKGAGIGLRDERIRLSFVDPEQHGVEFEGCEYIRRNGADLHKRKRGSGNG
jgi:hypothetical protein